MKKSIFVGVSLLAICLGLVGCGATAQPMTQDVAKRFDDITKFQYYVSRSIVLTSSEKTKVQAAVAGTAKIVTENTRNTFQILANTSGELLEITTDPTDGKTIYKVAFEVDNDNTLSFKQRNSGSDSKFYLFYDDPGDETITYGDVIYDVNYDVGGGASGSANDFGASMAGIFAGTYDGEDDPYLVVKIEEKTTTRETYGKASGRKVN
jgi:hypothetical protein